MPQTNDTVSNTNPEAAEPKDTAVTPENTSGEVVSSPEGEVQVATPEAPQAKPVEGEVPKGNSFIVFSDTEPGAESASSQDTAGRAAEKIEQKEDGVHDGNAVAVQGFSIEFGDGAQTAPTREKPEEVAESSPEETTKEETTTPVTKEAPLAEESPAPVTVKEETTQEEVQTENTEEVPAIPGVSIMTEENVEGETTLPLPGEAAAPSAEVPQEVAIDVVTVDDTQEKAGESSDEMISPVNGEVAGEHISSDIQIETVEENSPVEGAVAVSTDTPAEETPEEGTSVQEATQETSTPPEAETIEGLTIESVEDGTSPSQAEEVPSNEEALTSAPEVSVQEEPTSAENAVVSDIQIETETETQTQTSDESANEEVKREITSTQEQEESKEPSTAEEAQEGDSDISITEAERLRQEMEGTPEPEVEIKEVPDDQEIPITEELAATDQAIAELENEAVQSSADADAPDEGEKAEFLSIPAEGKDENLTHHRKLSKKQVLVFGGLGLVTLGAGGLGIFLMTASNPTIEPMQSSATIEMVDTTPAPGETREPVQTVEEATPEEESDYTPGHASNLEVEVNIQEVGEDFEPVEDGEEAPNRKIVLLLKNPSADTIEFSTGSCPAFQVVRDTENMEQVSVEYLEEKCVQKFTVLAGADTLIAEHGLALEKESIEPGDYRLQMPLYQLGVMTHTIVESFQIEASKQEVVAPRPGPRPRPRPRPTPAQTTADNTKEEEIKDTEDEGESEEEVLQTQMEEVPSIYEAPPASGEEGITEESTEEEVSETGETTQDEEINTKPQDVGEETRENESDDSPEASDETTQEEGNTVMQDDEVQDKEGTPVPTIDVSGAQDK